MSAPASRPDPSRARGLTLPRVSRFWRWSVGLLIGWAGLAYLLAPAVIRLAYEGRTFPFLNEMIAGRSANPVEVYLDSWRAAADGATMRLLGLALVIGALVEFRRPLGRLAQRLFGGTPTLRAASILLLGAWLGLVTGVVEALFVVVKTVLDGKPHWFLQMYSADVMWMAPLGGVVVFTVLAAVGALASVTFRLGAPLRLLMFLGVLLGLWSVFREARLGVHRWAVLLLAAGLAWRSAQLAARSERFLAVVRRSTIPLVAVVTLAGGWLHAGRVIRERASLEALPPTEPAPPNVLLLILDTVGAEDLSLYGYSRSTTPGLVAMAADAVVFDRAISPSSWTFTAHASLFTGQYPSALEVSSRQPLAARHQTLAEVLQERGYATGGFVANVSWATRRSGLEQGFLHYDDRPVSLGLLYSNSSVLRYAAQTLRKRARARIPMPRTRGADEINDAFLAWRDRIGPRPFFAFLNYIDGHSPYHAPGAFARRFSPDTRRLMLASGHYSRPELISLQAAYDEAIAYLDHCITELLGTLAAADALDNTIVIVTSDHGEQFGRPRLPHKGHGLTLYREVIQVPLLIRYPSVPAGLRVGAPITIADVPATVLDLAGLDTAGVLHGRSLARYWTAADRRLTAERPVLSEVRDGGFDPIPDWSLLTRGPMRSVAAGRWHYIMRADGGEEIYDIEHDPWEQHNLLASVDQSVLLHLRAMLADAGAPSRYAARASGGRVDASPAGERK